MTPQHESLTAKQQCALTIVVLVIFVAFSSVFAYAYIKGVQVRMRAEQAQITQAERVASLTTENSQKRATLIVCGTEGQALYAQAPEQSWPSGEWKISKVPAPSGDGLQTAMGVLAFPLAPNGWDVLKKGKVIVPANAEAGVYLAQCEDGYYIFRAVQRQKPQSSFHSVYNPLPMQEVQKN